MSFFNQANKYPFSYQGFLLPYAFNFIGFAIFAGSVILACETKFNHIALLKAHQEIIFFHMHNTILAGLGMMLFSRAKIEDGREGEIRSMAFGFLIIYQLGILGLKKEKDYFFTPHVVVIDPQLLLFTSMILALMIIYGFRGINLGKKVYNYLYEKFSKSGKGKKGD